MTPCLDARDIEGLIAGTLPPRRTAAVQRHLRECQTCAVALAEARANEAWLRGLQDTQEVGELRRRLAHTTGPGTAVPSDLTQTRAER